MTEQLGLDLPRLPAIARAQRWLFVGMVVVATVLALVGSLAQPSLYEASADLLFGRTTNSDAIVAEGATTPRSRPPGRRRPTSRIVVTARPSTSASPPQLALDVEP